MSVRFSSLPAVFACALCSYYLVEKPARAWLNRNW